MKDKPIAKKATLNDLNILVELMNEFYSEANFVLDYEIARNSFSEILSQPDLGSVFLLFYNSAPVGHVVLTTRFTMEYGSFIGYIDDLFVRKEYRRLGIANCGLAAILKECDKFQLKGLTVEVGESNEAAVRLYEKIGLTKIIDSRILMSKKIE